MTELPPGWSIDYDRGPDCLMVRLRIPAQAETAFSRKEGRLSNALWNLLENHLTYRLVLECDDAPTFGSELIGELVDLRKRIHDRAGMLRICGLSQENQSMLSAAEVAPHFAHYRDRRDAILGGRPMHAK